MRTFPTILLAAAVAAALGTTAPASAAPPHVPNPAHLTAHVVGTITPDPGGAFLESIAADGHGALVGSVNQWGVYYDDGTSADNFGQVVRVSPGGSVTDFGPAIDLGPCAMVTGVTVDDHGRVFLAVFNFAYTYAPEDPAEPNPCGSNVPSSVLRVTADGFTTAMTVPDGSMPNGITTVGNVLYVADSNGAVWRGSTTRETAPTAPWFASGLLEPTQGSQMGANGIAYRADALYVTSYSQGLFVRISIRDDGTAGRAKVITADPRLVHADGVTFDSLGRAWVTVNPEVLWDEDGMPTQLGDGSVVVISPSGALTVAATAPGTLDYPTQAVVDGRTVYVANGAYITGIFGASPSVVAFTS
jgi:sugar lactone lactonase YvrE